MAATRTWRVDCKRCDARLATPALLTFLQESDRAIHLSLKRDALHEGEGTLTLKADSCTQFQKRRQAHVGKLTTAPFTLHCVACESKIGSELVMKDWAQAEYLLDTKACNVVITVDAVADRVPFKKTAQLLGALQGHSVDVSVRNPKARIDDTTDDSEPDEVQLKPDAPHGPTRRKTRAKPAAAMVWPTVDTIRECFCDPNGKSSGLSTLRGYQIELVIGALLENTIIYLPTGCGKTLVAARVIAAFKKLNPTRKAVFLVPTGPLVSQQAAYVRRESELHVIELSGQHAEASNPRKRRTKLARADAMVATPQFLENMLSDDEIQLDEFCVIMFDEAHHATGESPYTDLLRRIAGMASERRPRIVALTASPFGERATPQTMVYNHALRGLCIAYNAKLDTPTIVDSLRELSAVFKKVEFDIVESGASATALYQGICRHVGDVSCRLSALLNDGSTLDISALFRHINDSGEDIYVMCGKLRKLQADLCPVGSTDRADAASLFTHMRRIVMVIPQFSIHSPLYLAKLLREYFARLEATEPRLYELLESSYDNDFSPLLQRFLPSPPTGKWQDEVSNKVQAVARIVEESHFDRNARAIVFVRRRKTALWLTEVMEKVPVLRQLNPTRFIGHNSYEGMTWEQEQRPTLERFRQGRIRMLVATSVLEEGLDVPECSLVIRFDGVVGMTSLVQSRGRARQAKGRFVVICNQATKTKLEMMVQNEVTMLEIARTEADMMDSKPTTRRVMQALARSQAREPDEEPRPTLMKPDDDTEADWSKMDSKLCIMFGITGSTFQPPTDTDLLAVVRAIDDCGCVDVTQADIKLGLIAMEPTLSHVDRHDFEAAYHELCQRVSFRVPKRGVSSRGALSFWIKMVTTSMIHGRAADFAVGGILTEELSEEVIPCGGMRRGRFVRHNMFIPSETWHFEKARLKNQSKLFVVKGGDMRYDFDLLSVHERTVWIETRGPNEWAIFMTFHHAPKVWRDESSRDCQDFHLVPLTFAFDIQSFPSVIARLRQGFMNEGLEVRDTKIDLCETDILDDDSLLDTETGLALHSSHIIAYAQMSLVSSWSFVLGARLPTRIVEILQRLENEAVRVQAMLRFEHKAQTEDDLVVEFQKFIHDQHPVLMGLTTLQERLILKVIVTPTRILFERPDVAPHNRVYRHFGPENFMMVYFRDENREHVDLDNAIEERLRNVMRRGIHIGGAHFKFLGCSLSQLRVANCVFTILDPDEVRRWVGDLDSIKSPAKYFKRLGQAFSSTRETIEVHPRVLLTPVDDIKDISGRYEFTDGCGEITKTTAENVAKSLRLSPVPSAFQIRLGGAKGVLVVSDFATIEDEANDSSDGGDLGVLLRKSMVKFPSTHNKLEIVAVASANSEAYLSRQSILILSDLGIDDAVFLTLQDEFLLSLSAMIVSDTLGLQEVRGSVPPEPNWWMNALYNHRTGDRLEIDPYHRRIIHAMYQYKLTNTVLRARIPIAKGRTLMGVADFTGTLEYGEVFVQYTERDPRGENDDLERVVVLSDIDVLIHRSPCHHPGDVRVLRCRGADTVPPALRQLRDCIVFPTRGPRPHPDECTGGDLDGDVYTVIWDERLIPPRDNVQDAMTLVEDLAVPEEDHLVTVPLLIEFYLSVRRLDILGMASHAHIALSDSAKHGCFDKHALILANICSLEVDCCKNPAFKAIVLQLMPRQYPDFLQSNKASYKSPKVLGRMFRRAQALLTHTAPNFGGAVGNDADEAYLPDGGYVKYTATARVLYEQYKMAIRLILKSCGAMSEAELATGMIIEMPSEYKGEYFRFGERSRDVFYNTQRTFRDLFEKAYGTKSTSIRRRVAAAWYHVAYSDPSDDRMLSFPWILADLMIENKNLHSSIPRNIVRTTVYDSSVSTALGIVTNRLQLSILNEIESHFGALLAAYYERLQAVTSLRLALGPYFDDQDVECVLFGSSALLTFEAQSDLDIVFPPVCSTAHLRELAQFAGSVEGISKATLRERTLVPILLLSLNEVWSVEISSARNGPIKTAWFRAYMATYPFFWPAAYFLIKWGKAAGLIRRRCLDGTGRSMFLPVGFLWLLVDFCVQHKFMQSIECPSHGLEPTDTEMEMSFWSTMRDRMLDRSHEPSAARVILAFFRVFGDLATPHSAFGFKDPLDPQNDTRLTDEYAAELQKKCYIAHHQLVVSNGDIASLLKHQEDHRRRITLSRALSRHVHRSPKFFAAKIMRESGVAHKEATLVFVHHPNALRADQYVADLKGDSDRVRRIEERIEKIEESLGAPRKHVPTDNVHRSGCCLLLFEGATEQSASVAFQRYMDARHAQHDTQVELHQAHLVSFSNGKQWLEHAIASFTARFMRQMIKLTHFERLNPGVARAKAIVRFGHHYLINLPRSFHEESISLATIEMLEREFERGRVARELYESVLEARQRDKKDHANDDDYERDLGRSKEKQSKMDSGDSGGGGDGSETRGGDEGDAGDTEPTKARPPLTLEKATAMTTRDRGVAHSFYPMIAPHAAPLLDTFAVTRKGMLAVAQTESYQVSIVRDGYEFNVRLTPTLQLGRVKTRPSRWLSATLKMRQELLDDGSRMDATPDIRLYVSDTEDVPSSDPLPQLLERACATARGRCGVLQFTDDSGRVRVAPELLDQGVELVEIVNVRHLACTTYASPLDGRELRVHDVRESARRPRAPRAVGRRVGGANAQGLSERGAQDRVRDGDAALDGRRAHGRGLRAAVCARGRGAGRVFTRARTA